tara:strand:+ start:377 stop:634 length:258 start_codon:yes stop_codon:yes gene_type:complete
MQKRRYESIKNLRTDIGISSLKKSLLLRKTLPRGNHRDLLDQESHVNQRHRQEEVLLPNAPKVKNNLKIMINIIPLARGIALVEG